MDDWHKGGPELEKYYREYASIGDIVPGSLACDPDQETCHALTWTVERQEDGSFLPKQCTKKKNKDDFCKAHSKVVQKVCKECKDDQGRPITHTYQWEHHGVPQNPGPHFYKHLDLLIADYEKKYGEGIDLKTKTKAPTKYQDPGCKGLLVEHCRGLPVTCNWSDKTQKCNFKSGYSGKSLSELRSLHEQTWNAKICIHPSSNGEAYVAQDYGNLEIGTRICGLRPDSHNARHPPNFKTVTYWNVEDITSVRKPRVKHTT